MGRERKEILDLAVKSRLPVTYHRREYVEAGGLMSYSVNFLDLDRGAAYYVDKSSKAAIPPNFPLSSPLSSSW